MIEMLKKITDELNEVVEDINKEKTLLSRIKSAELLNHKANVKLNELKNKLMKEEKDVEKLEKFTITNLIHTLLKDKEETIEKEVSEVIQVKNTIDNLSFDINDSERRILRLKSEMKGLKSLEDNYRVLLKDKSSLVEKLYPDKWEEILVINDKIKENIKMLKEVEEAISAGSRAKYSAREIITSLQKAKDWGTYDMLGGGLIATMAKSSHIDDAQNKLTNFRGHLREFSEELGDVGKNINSDFEIGEFLRFADWFFDGFFVDWAVQSKITNALESITDIHNKIIHLLNDLVSTDETLNNKNAVLNRNIENYIVEIV